MNTFFYGNVINFCTKHTIWTITIFDYILYVIVNGTYCLLDMNLLFYFKQLKFFFFNFRTRH